MKDTNMSWKHGEQGPVCFCGQPTVVVINDSGKVDLICLLHTKEAGAIYPLPRNNKPEKWPNLSDPEMMLLVDEGFMDQGEEIPVKVPSSQLN